jgi:phosphatidylglycerol:prolipoprotein diacylglycerol transferase
VNLSIPGLGEFPVYWYGVFLLAGALTALLVVHLAAGHNGRFGGHLVSLWVFAMAAAIVGGRLAAVLLGVTPEPLGRRGFVSAGGLALGALVSFLLVRLWKLPLFRLADAFAPAVAVGEAVTRIGTLLAGTGYGVPTSLPWGITFYDPDAPVRPLGVPLHPTQLYLAAGLTLIGAIAWVAARERPGEGTAMARYLIGAGLLRVAVEAVRGDRIPLTLFVSVGDAIGLAFVGAGLGFWWWRRLRRQRGGHVLRAVRPAH